MLDNDWDGWQYLASMLVRPHPTFRACNWNEHHGVVVESDDWGLCGEGKDGTSHSRLAAIGYPTEDDSRKANYVNTLESEGDLEGLYGVLTGYRDSLGRNPVLTANFVLANPWYSRIREDRFQRYHFVPITSGFPGSWAARNSVMEGWQLGIQNKLMVPEYHGLSHFNHGTWLNGLRNGDKKLLDFFAEEMVTTSKQHPTVSEYGVVRNTHVSYLSYLNQYNEIRLGCEIFRKTFKRYPRTTIPPHDISNPQTLAAFAKAGISQVQSERKKLTGILGIRSPRPGSMVEAAARIAAQLTFVFRGYRNIRLEQDESGKMDALETSLGIMRKGRPVVVGSHRQNYVGGVDSNNAENGRKMLSAYLSGLKEDSKLIFLSSFEASQLSIRGQSIEKFGDEYLIRNYTQSDSTVFIRGVGRHEVKDLMKEGPGSARIENLEKGSKVIAPAGRTLSLIPAN